MKKQVLSVGQCALDHSHISRMLADHFDVAVQTADSPDEAIRKAHAAKFDLILVNRVYDRTGEHGLATIRSLMATTERCASPVMLVSNFEDAQAAAIDAGAIRGFGKSSLDEPTTIEQLQPWLS